MNQRCKQSLVAARTRITASRLSSCYLPPCLSNIFCEVPVTSDHRNPITVSFGIILNILVTAQTALLWHFQPQTWWFYWLIFILQSGFCWNFSISKQLQKNSSCVPLDGWGVSPDRRPCCFSPVAVQSVLSSENWGCNQKQAARERESRS